MVKFPIYGSNRRILHFGGLQEWLSALTSQFKSLWHEERLVLEQVALVREAFYALVTILRIFII